MPTYDYECNKCGHEFELFQSITESHRRKCPECGKLKLRRLFGAGAAIVFKGSGFYQTDYRSESYRKSAEAERKASNLKSKEPRKQLLSNFAESNWYDNIVLQELDMLGEEPEFLRSLLRNFEDEGAKHVSNIKKAMYDDYLEYRDNLHALKGSATELGASKLVDICLEAEALKPFDMGSDKIRQMCINIELVFNETVAALNNATTANEKVYPVRITDQ